MPYRANKADWVRRDSMGGQKHALGRVLVAVAAMVLLAVVSGWAADADNDGVDDSIDACPDTVIPERVWKWAGFHERARKQAVLPWHYALTDDDTTFNTFWGKESHYTTADTVGCSCTQIMKVSKLGPEAGKHGCDYRVLQAFIAGMQMVPQGQPFPATGQTTSYQAIRNNGAGLVDVPDDGMVQAGAVLGYIDNGDGTITDTNTGLMWEKKGDNDDPLHDKDNTYSWSSGSEETIWDWLDQVNAEGGTGFAGYNDWRIPNLKELMSIVNYGAFIPAVPSEFHDNGSCVPGCTVTTCSCTVAAPYWSSTSFADGPTAAWRVDFFYGDMRLIDKAFPFDHVRAVRGGR